MTDPLDIEAVRAERDAFQARLDAATAELDDWLGEGFSFDPFYLAFRHALEGTVPE